jgi:hypothetical protein
MTGNQVIVNPVISQGFDAIWNRQFQVNHEQLTMVPSGYSPFWASNFGPPQGRRSKRPGGVFENTLRTFLTENAAAGQKGRPKQNSCEISGLKPCSNSVSIPSLAISALR